MVKVAVSESASRRLRVRQLLASGEPEDYNPEGPSARFPPWSSLRTEMSLSVWLSHGARGCRYHRGR